MGSGIVANGIRLFLHVDNVGIVVDKMEKGMWAL